MLISPVNNATNQPTTVTFIWNRTTGASSYTLQIASDSGFASIVLTEGLILDTLKTVSSLSVGTYYWRVCASNSAGTSPWSTIWNLSTIIPAPQSPSLSFPTNGSIGASTNPALSWNAAERAASYIVQVSIDSFFSTTVVNDSGITDTVHFATSLSNFTLYYWRVRAVNAGGTSSWSIVWNFMTGSTAIRPSNHTLPRAFSISGSFGNVRYALPKDCHVSLKYYDLRGRLVASLINSTQGAGHYVLSVKNSIPSKGTYIRVFEAGEYIKRNLVVMAGN